MRKCNLFEHQGAVNQEKNEEKHLGTASRNDEEASEIKSDIPPLFQCRHISSSHILTLSKK